MTKKHVMLDLETLGTVPGSIILSIGAVVFDESGVGGNGFHVSIDHDYWLPKFTTDPDTVSWWRQQSPEAQQAAFGGGLAPHDALDVFAKWYKRTEAEFVWGNGASFDQPMLEFAYAAYGMPAPWKYNASRCHRTLMDLSGLDKSEFPEGAVAHNALDDAKLQARDAVRAMQEIGQWRRDHGDLHGAWW